MLFLPCFSLDAFFFLHLHSKSPLCLHSSNASQPSFILSLLLNEDVIQMRSKNEELFQIKLCCKYLICKKSITASRETKVLKPGMSLISGHQSAAECLPNSAIPQLDWTSHKFPFRPGCGLCSPVYWNNANWQCFYPGSSTTASPLIPSLWKHPDVSLIGLSIIYSDLQVCC